MLEDILSIDIIVQWLTVGALVAQPIVLTITLYFLHKNWIVLKEHNELIIGRFASQSNVEKYRVNSANGCIQKLNVMLNQKASPLSLFFVSNSIWYLA